MYANREGPGHHDFESGKSVSFDLGLILSNVKCQWLEKSGGKDGWILILKV